MPVRYAIQKQEHIKPSNHPDPRLGAIVIGKGGTGKTNLIRCMSARNPNFTFIGEFQSVPDNDDDVDIVYVTFCGPPAYESIYNKYCTNMMSLRDFTEHTRQIRMGNALMIDRRIGTLVHVPIDLMNR